MIDRRAMCYLAIAVALIACGCQQDPPPPTSANAIAAPVTPSSTSGIVIGGIWPCAPDDYLALRTYTPPGYLPGTVLVSTGTIGRAPGAGGGWVTVWPTEWVTSASIVRGAQFRFQLPPGHYVLAATWAPGFWAAADVSVAAGHTTVEDVPNLHTCL